MGKKNKQKQTERLATGPLDIALSVIPPAYLVGLKTFAGACEHDDGTVAACALTGNILFGAGLVALVLAAMRLLAVDHRTRRSFDLFLLIAGVFIAVSPNTVFSLCMMETMRCRAVMLPFSRIMGVVLGLLAIACEATVDHEVPTGRKRRR